MKKLFFVAFCFSFAIFAVLTSLFVVLYFRLFPHRAIFVYPLSFVFGFLLGILFYLVLTKFMK